MNHHSNWKRLWARKFAPYISSIFIQAFLDNPKYSKCPNKLFVPEGGLQAIYFAEDEFKLLIDKYTQFLLTQDMLAYGRWYELQFSEFLEWAQRENSRGFHNRSNQELIEFLRLLTKKMIELSELQFLAFVVIEGPQTTVERAFKDNPKQHDILQWISEPYRKTEIVQAKLDLLRQVADRGGDGIDIAAYLKQYSWIPVYDFIDHSWSTAEIRHQIESIHDANQELDDFESHRAENLKNYVNYYRTVDDLELRSLINIVHNFAYLKEMRDDYRRHAYFLLQPFWQTVGERVKMTLEETNYLLANEVEKCLKASSPLFNDQVKQRMKHYSLTMIDGQVKIIASDVSSQYFDTPNHEGLLSGKVAFAGKVHGRVRIIYHRGEFGKFEAGDILVTTMTHPEFLPIMKQAKAIVTDEGGITCHAAIISREMKKPCIIGTKIATQVLKDGDMVVVDANTGIVRKLDD